MSNGFKLKGIFLDVENKKKPVVVEVDNNIYAFHKILRFDDIDIIDDIDIKRRTFGEKEFRVVADDIGYFRHIPKFSAYPSSGRLGIMPLVGNLLIFGMEDKFGEMTDLTDEDIELILSNVEEHDGRYVFVNCD